MEKITKLKMNKKGEEDTSGLAETLVFILLILVVFSGVYFFVNKVSQGDIFYEKTYSKSIVLSLERARPGMNLYFDFNKIYSIMEKNDFQGTPLKIGGGKVLVKTSASSHYEQEFFSDYQIKVEEMDKPVGFINISVRQND